MSLRDRNSPKAFNKEIDMVHLIWIIASLIFLAIVVILDDANWDRKEHNK